MDKNNETKSSEEIEIDRRTREAAKLKDPIE